MEAEKVQNIQELSESIARLEVALNRVDHIVEGTLHKKEVEPVTETRKSLLSAIDIVSQCIVSECSGELQRVTNNNKPNYCLYTLQGSNAEGMYYKGSCGHRVVLEKQPTEDNICQQCERPIKV